MQGLAIKGIAHQISSNRSKEIAEMGYCIQKRKQ